VKQQKTDSRRRPSTDPSQNLSDDEETSDRRSAAAVGYDPDADAAPRVVARGKGELADRIIAIARRHDIPIKEDRDLVAVLAQLDLDREIPPELYRTLAELLAWVYRVNRRWNDRP
jgi:flagellar biosynthesis protein